MSKYVDYETKVLEVSNLEEYFKVGVGKNKLKVKAVDDISFDVYKKEVFGLVGESGCGKTTTGRTILRLYKPTNGTVKLNGKIIGSGSDSTYRLLKKEKKEHFFKILKLNQYRYDVYKLNEEFNNQRAVLINKIKLLKLQYEKEVGIIKSEISAYNSSLFEARNQLKVDIEKISFEFKVNKDNVIKQTKNEYLIEYNHLLNGMKIAFNKKMDGINESAALSKEAKSQHKTRLSEDYNKKIKMASEDFLPKIEKRSKNLLSDNDCKLQLNQLKKDYLFKKLELNQKHNDFVERLSKPNYKNIKENSLKAKKRVNFEIDKIENQIQELSKHRRDELLKINSSKKIDREKLIKIQIDYKKFVNHSKNIIRESKHQNNSEEAKKNVLNMQMIFQDPISSLNPRMTVQEIISEGLIIAGEKDKELIRKKVIEVLELVGLAPEYISRYPHEFSGGQRQRIGIARALIMKPSIIIADEPISALDVSIKAQVINLLSELREKLDLTILFIAHDLSIVKFFCDRIAVMYFGKIVELASSEELFKHPLHSYTKSLLSAIPHPDPDSEKKRKRISYSPLSHDYSEDKPEFFEITKNHFVFANKKELLDMKKEIGGNDED